MQTQALSTSKTPRRRIASFDTTPEDAAVISKIVERIKKYQAASKIPCAYTPLDLDMSLTACHVNGCPLRLDDLLAADDFNLLHDVYGIHANISKITGELEHCFVPRFALTQAATIKRALRAGTKTPTKTRK